jgi:hypothetical protein
VAWTIDDYLTWTGDNDPESRDSAQSFIDALRVASYVIDGGRGETPSLSTRLDVPALGSKPVFTLYAYKTGASIEFGFDYFKRSTIVAEDFLLAVASIAATSIDPFSVREAGYAKRPNIQMSLLTPDEATQLVENVTKAIMRVAVS